MLLRDVARRAGVSHSASAHYDPGNAEFVAASEADYVRTSSPANARVAGAGVGRVGEVPKLADRPGPVTDRLTSAILVL